MSQELPKAYEPSAVESDIVALWKKHELGKPSEKHGAKPYCIINPPTNANGALHIGHAVGITLQDLMIRYHRMKGDATLWVPGFDHAGFETQTVFDKKLEKEGRSRFKMKRQELYDEMYDFTQEKIDEMRPQFEKLGASLDWSKEIFTLDPRVVNIVYKTFKDLYDDDLVYRGERSINWCVKHQTTLAELETRYEERQDEFYYFKYGPFTIGTARPETKFGDKYVVMHPDDPRYKEYKQGQTLQVEWINGPITATIIKDEAVDMEFGTGVMTITPWHDATDFEIAKRHNLPIEQVIDQFGKLLPIASEFEGMKIAAARPLIVEKLDKKSLVEKIEANYKHNVQVCYKCNTVVEPQVLPQWYIAMTKTGNSGKNLRDDAVAAAKAGRVKFVSKKFENLYYSWLSNIRDWNISHQIVWGIQLPIWYCRCDDCSCEPIVTDGSTPEACPSCGSKQLDRDPDVFNTWFSSGQWPLAALRAQDQALFEKYYPTAVMETGYDIIFFWVARMIMLGLYTTGEVPFSDVYLHGLVRDKDRQKMSKSKGNVIDPLGIAEHYGSDAVRLALIFGASAGNDIVITEEKIKGMRNFANKLWNIARFVLLNLEDSTFNTDELANVSLKTEADKTLFSKLGSDLVPSITQNIDNYQFHLAAEKLYDFIWHDFADNYLETAKAQLANPETKESTQKILLVALRTQVCLLHPLMPFVTEAIYQSLPITDKPPLLATAEWPRTAREAGV